MTQKINCKPGDLAVAISPNHSINQGSIVEILRKCDRSTDLAYPPDMLVWTVRSSRYMKWTFFGRNYYRKEGPIPDFVLQPIRGEALEKEARKEEVTSTNEGFVQSLKA